MSEYFPGGITEEKLQFALIVGIIRIIIWLFFAYTVYSTLKLVKKENQCILPKQAWFLAIPFFNIYWNFEVVRRLGDSLNNEFYDIPLPMFILVTLVLLHLVYFITYWIRIAQHKSLLKLHIAHYGVDYVAQEKEKYEN